MFNPAEYVIENLQSYGEYFNEDRAIPSIYSGLKPSQTKILYGAKLLGLKSTGKNKKVINLVGAVMPFYQHGDASLIGAIDKMGQPWRMTYPVLNIQGNFGSQSNLGAPNSGAAGPRYIETKLTPLGELLLESVKDGTAKMVPNFDNSMEEPEHLFAPIPCFLLFNQKGIGVGTATSIPSFKLDSVIKATQKLIENPNTTYEELANILQPYFTQEPVVVNKKELPEVYSHIPRDGKKSAIKLRARFQILDNKLIITNFPPNAYPSKIVEQIDKKDIPSFKNIIKAQDTTSLDKNEKEQVSMELVLSSNVNVDELIQDLCENTNLQSYSTVNLVLLDKNGKVKEYNVKTALLEWIEIFREKVADKLINEQNGLNKRKEILIGLIKVLSDDIDEIIALIKSSESRAIAKNKIQGRGYTDLQADAILDMKLVKLANLEYQKLLNEKEEIQTRLDEIAGLLNDQTAILTLMSSTMQNYAKLDTYGKLEIVDNEFVKIKKLKSERIYVQSVKNGIKISEEFIKGAEIATKDEPIYALSENFTIPITSAKDNFIPNVHMLFKSQEQGEILHFSKDGYVKRTNIQELKSSRKAIATKQEVFTCLKPMANHKYILIETKQGKKVQFEISEVPLTKRGAKGIIGIKLAPGDNIIRASLTALLDKNIKLKRGV